MEKSAKTGNVICSGGNDEIFLLINITAEIHPLLKKAGIGLREGLVIFAENSDIYYKILQYLKNTGAEFCKNMGKLNSDVPNNKLAIHPHHRYDREEAIIKFLDSDGFMPTIIVHSILPVSLSGSENLIVVEGSVGFQSESLKKLRSFVDYIHKNPKLLKKYIKFYLTSELYLQSVSKIRLQIAMEASAEVFCCYLREVYDETQSSQTRTFLQRAIRDCMARADCCGGEWDVLCATKRAIESYLDANPQILIGSIDAVEGNLEKAVEKSEAILYDGEFYYFPECVLRRACEMIRDIVSFAIVKRELAENGVLYTNQIEGGNYTVKKTIFNSYGFKFRARFLKIYGEFFDEDGDLGLWERRNSICS